MQLLAIETSCDETAAAVIADRGDPARPWEIRSNIVASQAAIHREWGGVVPEIASRQHVRDICGVVEAALEQAGIGMGDVGAVAVTQGPGLVGSLLVGVSFAKALAWSRRIAVVPVHHLAGHIESLTLAHGELPLPATVLVVSGGHTSLYFIEAPGQYRPIARTRDDAAGEAYDKVAKLLGLGQKFELPGAAQRYGTIPDAAWKMRRYKQEWSAADSLNASIGQGYVSVSPLQLAIMTSRIASGRNLQPSLLFGHEKPPGPALPFTPEQFAVAHDGMFRVVNGSGTGTGSRIDIGGIKMAGKTGTAQVRALISRGHVGDWKSRDHSLFVCYAPTDIPRYAMSVVVEHGTFGARAAAPIAKDVMTFLFDPAKAWEVLLALEKGWGGTPSERMAGKYQAYSAQYGTSAPKVEIGDAAKAADASADKQNAAVVDDTAPQRPENDAPPASPSASAAPPSPNQAASPAAAPSPTATPTPEAQ